MTDAITITITITHYNMVAYLLSYVTAKLVPSRSYVRDLPI